MHSTMDEKTRLARIKGEQERALTNIAARTGLPEQQWWLSFVGDEGFRGVVIAHGNDFAEALMDATMHDCNPRGEVQGHPIPLQIVIPKEWTYRILSRTDAAQLDELLAKENKTEGKS